MKKRPADARFPDFPPTKIFFLQQSKGKKKKGGGYLGVFVLGDVDGGLAGVANTVVVERLGLNEVEKFVSLQLGGR